MRVRAAHRASCSSKCHGLLCFDLRNVALALQNHVGQSSSSPLKRFLRVSLWGTWSSGYSAGELPRSLVPVDGEGAGGQWPYHLVDGETACMGLGSR